MFRDSDCSRCVHFRHDLTGYKCAAFPIAIPVELALGDRGHRAPYPGDNGIRFEPLNFGTPPGDVRDIRPG